MIRAIIFDCFGVLATDGWLPYKSRHFGGDQERYEQAGALNKRLDAGLMSYHDFVVAVARLAGISLKQARYEIENNVRNEQLFDLIESDLKPHYKIGMLSNAGNNWLFDLFTPQQITLFDATVLSYEIGFVKPQKQAYETIAVRLGLRPDECVFTDDQPAYVAGAERAGMSAVLFTSAAALKDQLSAIS